MIYIIKSNYKYEIEANDKHEALEKWNSEIEEELGTMNETIQTKFVDSLYAEPLRIKCKKCMDTQYIMNEKKEMVLCECVKKEIKELDEYSCSCHEGGKPENHVFWSMENYRESGTPVCPFCDDDMYLI